jgi:hypothetical protein
MLSTGSLLGESNEGRIQAFEISRAVGRGRAIRAREAFKVTRTKLVHASDRFFIAGRD